MNDDEPVITVTDAALRAVRIAEADQGAEADSVLHLTVDAHYQNDLYFGPKEPGELVITASGIAIAMDAGTARRVNGVTLDYTSGRGGVGFKIDNPNESPPVKGIHPADLRRMLGRREAIELIDARGADERASASVASSRLLDERYERELLAMPKTEKLVFMAHHSRGGLTAALRFHERGFTNVWYVVGGIDGWSTMDPSVPRY
jgi:monothiol glutaredoxin